MRPAIQGVSAPIPEPSAVFQDKKALKIEIGKQIEALIKMRKEIVNSEIEANREVSLRQRTPRVAPKGIRLSRMSRSPLHDLRLLRHQRPVQNRLITCKR